MLRRHGIEAFGGHELRPDLTTAYTHPDVIAAVCVSEDNRRYLSYAFPKLRLIRMIRGIPVCSRMLAAIPARKPDAQ